MSPENAFGGDKYVTLKTENNNFGNDKYVTLKQVRNVMMAVFKGFGVSCLFFRLAVTNMSLFYRYQAPQRKRARVKTAERHFNVVNDATVSVIALPDDSIWTGNRSHRTSKTVDN